MSGLELVGVIASGFTLWDVLTKLEKFSGKVKDADEQFQRYVTNLKDLHNIVSVINNVTSGIKGLEHLTIQDNTGQDHGLVDYCIGNVERAISDAQNLLKFLKQSGNKWYHRLIRYTKERGLAILVALRQDDIQRKVEHVVSATTTLSFAMTIIHLHITDTGHSETLTLINDAKNQIAKSIQAIKPRPATPAQQKTIRVHITNERPHRISRVIPRLSGYRKREAPQSNARSRDGSVWNSSRASTSSERYTTTTTTTYDKTLNQILGPVPALAMCSSSANQLSDLPGNELPSSTSSVSEFTGEDPAMDDIEAVFDNGQILFVYTDRDNPENPKVTIRKPKMLDNGECNFVDEEDVVFASGSDTGHLSAFLRTGICHEKLEASTRPCVGWFNIPSSCCITTVMLPTAETVSGSNSDLEYEARELNSICSRRSHSTSQTKEDILTPRTTNHRVSMPFDGGFINPQPAGTEGLGGDDINSTDRIILCIQEISRRGCQTEMRLRVQCKPSVSCQHATVEMLDGEGTLHEASNFRKLLIICFRNAKFACEPIRYQKGVDLPLFDKCQDYCSHTLVEEFSHSRIRCMEPACFGAWSDHCVEVNDRQAEEKNSEETGSSGCVSQDGEKDSEETGSNDSISPDEAGSDSDSRGSENEGQEPGANAFGPFLSVPCLYCGEAALRPQPALFDFVALYSRRKLGYRCSRCQARNWIVGRKWIWE